MPLIKYFIFHQRKMACNKWKQFFFPRETFQIWILITWWSSLKALMRRTILIVTPTHNARQTQIRPGLILLSPKISLLGAHKDPNKSALSAAANEAEQKRMISHKRLGVCPILPCLVQMTWGCLSPSRTPNGSTRPYLPSCAICLANVICTAL